MSALIASRGHITNLLATTVFHCFDGEEFGLSAKHATAVTDALAVVLLDLESPALQVRLAQACGDPGSIVGRQHHINESIPRWSMRAVLHVLAEGRP